MISAGSWGVALLLIAVAAIGFVLAALFASIVIAEVTGVVVVFAVLLLAIVISTLRQIFLADLYRFATTGEAPRGFSQVTLQQALRQG